MGRVADWAEMINQLPGSPLPQPWPQLPSPSFLIQSSKWQERSRTVIQTLEFQIRKAESGSVLGWGTEGQGESHLERGVR